MAGKIFVNYRRDDCAAHALNVAQYLEKQFGSKNVFLDVDRLKAGERFPKVLEERLSESRVMLAMIGPGWLDAADAQGRRRLDDPDDWVRLEIVRALARGIPVIPVLVAGAALPPRSALPDDLKPLLDHQVATLTTNGFRHEMAGLARDLKSLLKTSYRLPALVAGVAGAGALAVAAFYGFQVSVPSTAPEPVAPIAAEPAPPSPVRPQEQDEAGISTVAKAVPDSPAAEPASRTTDQDALLQKSPMWQVLKRNFPDWYREQVSSIERMSAEKLPDREIDRKVAEAIVALRRKNADHAIQSGPEGTEAIAKAFIGTLNDLKATDTKACYDFISKGELGGGLTDRIRDVTNSTPLKDQLTAIFTAIAAGRASPKEPEKPLSSDYTALAEALGKLGWSQDDIQLFADPRALAKSPETKVCNMVGEWFSAHLRIEDRAVRTRLLAETLRLVVAG